MFGMAEQRRWDQLVAERHYLSFTCFFGKALRHVAHCRGEWLALLGWQAGAFKVGVRDAWIGWTSAQRHRRLHLVANNGRFLLLTGAGSAPNLASRVLALSLRRLSDDMLKLHGYPVHLAETFVDISRFSGVCYRAANWQSLGLTRGFSRLPGKVHWTYNGQPKEVLVFDLNKNAAPLLSSATLPDDSNAKARGKAPAAATLNSMYNHFDQMPDFRKRRGQRYGLGCYLVIATAARMAGFRGVTALAEFADSLDSEQRQAVGAFWSERLQKYTVPTESTFRYILSNLPPDTLDQALQDWAAAVGDGGPVAMDGKVIIGASTSGKGGKRMTVAAFEHGSGIVIGQNMVDDKSNEIPAVRDLALKLELAGRTVTVDAMHTQQETARLLCDECKADYVMTAVKGNQSQMREDVEDIDWHGDDVRCHEGEWEKGHGRLEKRSCRAVDITGPQWDGFCNLYGRRQAMRIERQRFCLKSQKTSREIAWCLTSLDASKAGPRQLGELVRGHWRIETRLHYVRDFTFDEDRCRVHVRHTPRNLASLTNAAIALIRLHGRYKSIAKANRYFARRSQEALDAVINPSPG